MSLTSEQRRALPDSDFAVPGRRAFPIHDDRHVRLAWQRIISAAGLTDQEREDARQGIMLRAADLGVDLATAHGIDSLKFEAPSISAMALATPTGDHPNKMPFTGVLTLVDQPSDRAPGGSGGKRVILTKAAAERALPSLLGMAVNVTASFDGHDPSAKIGIIDSASIEGNAIQVGGFVYARDFPKAASHIQAGQDDLGFSYELADIWVQSLTCDPLVITDCVFTGAAILRKDKAAYSSTSLAASADEDTMTKEEIAAAVGEAIAPALKPLTDTVAALTANLEAQAQQITDLKAAADKEAKDAAAAAQQAKDDELAALKTKVADLQAAAEKASKEPERKTMSPQIAAILARADITVPEDGKLSVGTVDQALGKAGLSVTQRMQVKNELQRTGRL